MHTTRRERLAPAVLAGAAAAAAPALIEWGFGTTPYQVVKRHADLGAKLIDELGGFPDSVRRLLRDHHERLDGTGYPAGLRADELPLDTRTMAVCDVYDALISPRVYRGAWTHEQAMSLLRAEVGTSFDSRCVEALAGVLRAEAGTGPSARMPQPVLPALSATASA
jgi:HD-GYP domain-containing protein (c-di-GMP phosphodiesterase class II)